MWLVSENKEQDRSINRKVDGEWGTKKTINILNSRLYH